MPYAGQVDKTMGADTVGHLKHLLDTELRRAREENDLDIAMFLGVDGRIFSSSIPDRLEPREYRLLNLLKGNLAHICNQLAGQNMMMSVQQFEAGTVVISGVGDRAFLVFLTTKPVEITKMQGVLANVLKTSIVVRHLFESKPITPEILASYDEAVAGELKRLTRILLVEKFGESKELKKNKEIAQYLQSKLGVLVGKETYLGWTSFNVAVRESRTAFSIEGDVTPLTDMAITDIDGDVVGYLYAMRQCCYVPTIFRTRFAVGRMSPADQAVTNEYNENVHNIAVCNFCVFHERFREEIAKNVTIAGNPLACLLLATRGWSGETKISSKNVVQVNINEDHVRALLRNYECVYALVLRGARIKGER